MTTPHNGPDTGPLLDTVIFEAKPRLIGLCSPAMGSGKSVVATRLVDKHGFQLLKFADFLKNMIRQLLRDVGYDEAEVEDMVNGGKKEWIIPEIGCTSRWLQQSLGTEWGRDQIRADLWVHLNEVKTRSLLDAGHSVVFDDMRFINEFEMVEQLGGQPVRVIRPGLVVPLAHASEGALDHLTMTELVNDDTILALEQAADQLVATMSGSDRPDRR